jgi:hypothetical protein
LGGGLILAAPFFNTRSRERMIELKDIRPQSAKFKLAYNETEYELRPFNLNDEAWLRTEFKDTLQQLFSQDKIDDDALCRIAYHQIKDRSDFVEVEREMIDEAGRKMTYKIGGFALLKERVHGMNEKIEILLAINETLGISRGLIEESNKKTEKKKK